VAELPTALGQTGFPQTLHLDNVDDASYTGVWQGTVLSPFLFALYLDDISKLGSSFKRCCMILYVDDIFILSPSVSQLEHLLHACESELAWLDMAINFSKSCIRVGPQCDKSCANISRKTGINIPWVTEMRYLGVLLCAIQEFEMFVNCRHARFLSGN